MSGRHEPPSKRSFFFSLATSAIRFAIIVSLVVAGVVLVGNAFSSGELPVAAPSGGPAGSPTPSPTATKSPKPPPSPQLQGLRVAVFNGTTITGLAGETANKLQTKYGAVVAQDPADAPQKPLETTTLYYRTAQAKVNAEFLAKDFFKGLSVKVTKLPSTATNVDKSVQVAIYLGTDYGTPTQ